MGMPAVLPRPSNGRMFDDSNSLGIAFAVICCSTLRVFYAIALLISMKERNRREERTLPFLQTLLGLLLMGVAYYMVLTVTKPVAAIGNFFIAVVMVIVITYLLFNAGSITLLKFLKGAKATTIKRRISFLFPISSRDA